MRVLTIYRKTFGDLSNPKLLAGYLVPFLAVAWFFGLLLADAVFTNATAPLAQQEAKLTAQFLAVSFFWGAGIPVMALAAILCANTLATEAEQGTLRILLSKPVSRWKILLGTFVAVVVFAGLAALANLLLSASLIVGMADVTPAAIPEGIVATLPGTLLFALFGASVVTALGLALAVYTQNRLKTALGALVVPALYFVFWSIRALSTEAYEDYQLYFLDVNYHFGNAFVYLHEAVGTEFGIRTQLTLAPWTGVYERPAEEPETPPESLEVAGHVPMEVSVALLSVVAVVALVAAVYRFQQMDV
jgi:ABC-2 type transport system permease protein